MSIVHFHRSSTSVENLKYLSVDQALADLAHFITEITSDRQLNATGGVILVGGSYGGTMVTWFRQKYPHLVNGAWASSAPLNAQVDFHEYKEVVSQSILTVGGEECYNKVVESFIALEDLLENDEIVRVRALFELCEDFDDNDHWNVWTFNSYVAEVFADFVQNHRRRPNIDITLMCASLLEDNSNSSEYLVHDPLYTFARFVREQINPLDDDCLRLTYRDAVEYLSDTEWSSKGVAESMRQWVYQTCSEFGWYQTSTSEEQIFGAQFPIDLFIRMCTDVYGSRYVAITFRFSFLFPHCFSASRTCRFTNASIHENIDRKNAIYGSFNPRVRNVFSTHGSIDPWHRMGVLRHVNPSSPVLMIPGASHCNDLVSINENDSRHLRLAKLSIRVLATRWLRLPIF